MTSTPSHDELVEIVYDLATQEQETATRLFAQDELVATLITAMEATKTRLDGLEGGTAASSDVDDDDKLRTWVNEWLLVTFPNHAPTIRGWEDIPAYHSELAAAFAGWLQIRDPKASGFDRMSWHSMLAATMDRIRTHTPPIPSSAMSALTVRR